MPIKAQLRLGLFPKILIAITLGLLMSWIIPYPIIRVFVTFNTLFSNFLNFIIPLIILGLIAPGIAELGQKAGKMLLFTVLIAYGSTLFAGLISFASCQWFYPIILSDHNIETTALSALNPDLTSYFTIQLPPLFDVMSALILAFILGIGMSSQKEGRMKEVMNEFQQIINLTITKVIIPILPIYIFGIFLKMGTEQQLIELLGLFLKIIGFIFVLHVLLILLQYTIAGVIVRRNPLRLLKTMLPAYATALGTQSSAATIPVTLMQAKKNGVSTEVADFAIPLCATIHLSGSILKIVACAIAIMYLYAMPINGGVMIGFIALLGVTMIAAPGVPGGAIMAALGVLSTVLAFNPQLQALMISLYIAMDSFGTACNVTGDGAIALVLDQINKRKVL